MTHSQNAEPDYTDAYAGAGATNSKAPATTGAGADSGALEATPATDEKPQGKGKVSGSFAASTWVALIIGFLLLILLIVFIMQNQQSVPVNFLGWSGDFPAGIAFLLFAIAGALIMACVGGWRMFELRRQVKRAGR
ncbi:LapA family protein [Corynebacterium confusum]|uniref:LapA family protein n=1 Tax=uncultured Corynebacterium sp. TaxID=159447 RepID=UPI0025F30D5A|nr:lipopolysaccharide assembly protein LapA domain-containing protein [uncultured Corynebacterium sp.]